MGFRVRRLAIPWVATLIIALVPAPLDAHAELRRSFPAGGDRLGVAPRELRLWFSEQPQAAFTHLRLLGPDSADVSLGEVRPAPDMSVVAAVSGTLRPGRYTVVWQTGGADGHPSRGRFAFTVTGEAEASGDTAVAAGTMSHDRTHVSVSDDPGHAPLDRNTAMEAGAERGIPATRWLEFVGLLGVVGTLSFRHLVRRSGLAPEVEAAAIDAALRLAQAALFLLLSSALLRFHGQSVALHGATAYEPETLRATMLGTSWGRGWLVGVLAVPVTAAGFAVSRRHPGGWLLAAAGAIAAALSPALTGHAIGLAGSRAVAVAVDWLHVLAAGIWLGTLLMLVLAGIPALQRTASPVGPSVAALVRRFSPMALTGAGALGLTGVVSAFLRLTAVDQLWSSGYGRTLLLKLALFAIVLALGAINWRRIGPSLGDDASPGKIRRSATFELIVAGLVLAVTAALVSTPPPSRLATATSAAETNISPSGVSR